MNYGQAEAGVGVLSYQDLTRQEAEDEATRTYLCRVLVRQYPLRSAPSRLVQGTDLTVSGSVFVGQVLFQLVG